MTQKLFIPKQEKPEKPLEIQDVLEELERAVAKTGQLYSINSSVSLFKAISCLQECQGTIKATKATEQATADAQEVPNLPGFGK